MRAEIPIDGLEAFRLASFNIEYVPQFGYVWYDLHTHAARYYATPYEPLFSDYGSL